MATAKYTVRRTSAGSSTRASRVRSATEGAEVSEPGGSAPLAPLAAPAPRQARQQRGKNKGLQGLQQACAPQRQLPPMRAAPRQPRPLEVEKLDSWFEGVSQPSRRIQDLVRRKRERHDALLRQLRQELFRERTGAESTVAFISANLRTELDKASLMVKLKGQGLGQDAVEAEARPRPRPDPRAEAEALLQAEAAAGEVVQQLTEQRRRAVDAFYDLLLDVEDEHQRRAKAVLRKFGKALAANGHLPPHRLQPLLDAQRKCPMLEVARPYEWDKDGGARAICFGISLMSLRADAVLVPSPQEVGELHVRHVVSFGDLRLCLNMHAERDQRRFLEAVESFRRQRSERRQREALAAIQEAANKSMDEYIEATSMGRCCVEDFESRLDELKVAVAWSESYPFSTVTVKGWVASKELVKKLTKRFNSFACLLREAGELWENFCTLQELSRQKTLQRLNDAEPLRTKCVEAKELRIAKIIAKSKEVINKQHLHENVSRIFRILDEVKCSLENMHKREKNVIEEHTSFFDSELESFDPQLHIFLDKYGKEAVKDDFSVSTSNLSRNFALLEAVIQITEQENTRCFKEINTFMQDQFKDRALVEEKLWMQEMRRKLEEEFDDIMNSHQVRYNDIQIEVETVRLVQIDDNKKALDFQKEAQNLNEMFVKELQIFTNFSSQIKTLQKKGLDDKVTTSVRYTIQEVEICYKMCKETIKNLNIDFQFTVRTQIDDMKKNNLQYIAGLRHFSDGGTFSEQEITDLKTEISSLERDVEALAQNHILSLKERKKSLIIYIGKSLQFHLENLDYTQNVTALIQKTQCELKKHTLALKYGGKLLTEQVTGLDDEKMHDIKTKWRQEYFAANICGCVIQTVSRRLDCLLTKEQRSTAADIDMSYSSVLMIYNEGCDFLSVIFHVLAESLEEIEHTVLGFNDLKIDHTASKPGLHEEGKSFMTDIASTYRLYQEQCLDTWINELTVFLETISKLKNKHEEYSSNSFNIMNKKFSRLLEDEQSELTKTLKDLRREYQEHQVNAMAEFKPLQEFSESQYVFSSLCGEFERLSSLLSENIKKLIESYMERAHQYLQNYESDLKEQISFIRETSEKLFDHRIIEDISRRIDEELKHLNELFTFTIAIDPIVFPQLRGKVLISK
ncbi:NAD-dependent malic enzyme [Frankliniella fusca]|uniref:NAD-dependent malic enzyme n=1 Tax=Frankliniella fusca TaxID=407009 RepID=A0AAE1HS44_9NEOP|nr:NAD-dependent malic enzyme [Frankliniella fusca]